MFSRNKKDKPKLKVVEPLFPNKKQQISNLSDRLYEIIGEYCEQEHSRGRLVTRAEIVGVIELLKDRIK